MAWRYAVKGTTVVTSNGTRHFPILIAPDPALAAAVATALATTPVPNDIMANVVRQFDEVEAAFGIEDDDIG